MDANDGELKTETRSMIYKGKIKSDLYTEKERGEGLGVGGARRQRSQQKGSGLWLNCDALNHAVCVPLCSLSL